MDHLTGVLSAEAPKLMKKADHIASDVNTVTAELRAQVPTLSRTLTNADKTMAILPHTLSGFDSLQTKVEDTLSRTNPLLDKANSFDEAKFRELTENVLLKTGMKVYMHPFGAPDTSSEWKKQPVKQ